MQPLTFLFILIIVYLAIFFVAFSRFIVIFCMVHSPFAPKESFSKGPSSAEEKLKSTENQQDLGVSVDTSGILSEVDSVEDGAEGGIGRVRENTEGIGENQQSTSGKFQHFQQKMTDEQAKALKAKLLTALPAKKVMIRDIRQHISKELDDWKVKAKISQRHGALRELSESVKKMRELKKLLRQLLYATTEIIKNIWLKVVHGIV
ncbi:MAG: hypothetical protein ACD_28C00317G0018 [uncultured bacterium]|nr:MAG: hypothetical protein ACD_28C00317G0018 [uncultured bacterium]KKT77118.1 MAG: hypothetical protein UW70_C0003G0016 [Candidatus Peregrinibacteria bacterium GW2011_GWA2_44_7]